MDCVKVAVPTLAKEIRPRIIKDVSALGSREAYLYLVSSIRGEVGRTESSAGHRDLGRIGVL